MLRQDAAQGGLSAASLVRLSSFHTESVASNINGDEIAMHLVEIYLLY